MKLTLALLLASGFAVDAAATTIQGTPPAVPSDATAPKFAVVQAATKQTDDSAGLRRGTVQAVSIAGGTFNVYGEGMTFDPKSVKVFGRDGKPASISSLRKGASVRFTLDPRDRLHRRVAVIYLD